MCENLSSDLKIRDLVGIVIVNYNGKNCLEDCIESIYQSNYTNYSIILVDNGSSDGSEKEISLKYPDIVLIKSKKNLGFGAGNNLGFQYAIDNHFKFVIPLNSDTVIKNDTISCLVLEAKKKNCIIVPKMLFFSNPHYIWYAGGEINYNKCTAVHYGEEQLDSPEFNIVQKVNFFTGCCFCLSVELLQSLGDFDENFFMYYEDMDFSLRAQKMHIDIEYYPKAVILHAIKMRKESQMTFQKIVWIKNSRKYILKKYKNDFTFFAKFYSYLANCKYNLLLLKGR